MNFVKITASIISCMMPLSVAAMGLTIQAEGQITVLTDVPKESWFYVYVEQAANAGIVSGYKDAEGNSTGQYGPGNNITIAEALKIAVEGAGYKVEEYSVGTEFGTHWSAKYQAVAQAEGFAVVDGNVNVDRPATRAEVAAIFASAFNVDTEGASETYSDVDTSTKYQSYISALSRDGIVSGDTDAEGNAKGTFRPSDSINRAEVAKMIVESQQEYGKPGMSHSESKEMEKEPEVNTEASAHVIMYTDDGFMPSKITIKQGDLIEFHNQSSSKMWVASDPHPVHTDLPEFDAFQGHEVGEMYIHTFTDAGEWGFHNHLNSSHSGMVEVAAE